MLIVRSIDLCFQLVCWLCLRETKEERNFSFKRWLMCKLCDAIIRSSVYLRTLKMSCLRVCATAARWMRAGHWLTEEFVLCHFLSIIQLASWLLASLWNVLHCSWAIQNQIILSRDQKLLKTWKHFYDFKSCMVTKSKLTQFTDFSTATKNRIAGQE